jgi:hypothetical protein
MLDYLNRITDPHINRAFRDLIDAINAQQEAQEAVQSSLSNLHNQAAQVAASKPQQSTPPQIGTLGTKNQITVTPSPIGNTLTLPQDIAKTSTPTFAGLTGTTTNNDAAAGTIGEYIFSDINSGAPVPLTSPTPSNVTNIALTAGDWDVDGVVGFSTSGASSTDFKAGSHSVSATFGADNTWANLPLIATGLTDVVSLNIPRRRYSLAAPATVYLVAAATFSLGTVGAYGLVRARRVR